MCGMIETRSVPYHGDGVRMIGFLAFDNERAGPRPAVIVAHEAPGLDDFNRERCKRLAALGYAAFALDFHGEGEVIQDRSKMMQRLEAFTADPLRTRARAESALAAVRAQAGVDGKRVAAIGYCFGGTIALELARGGADIKAAVGFHAGLATSRPKDAKNIRARVLICNGADDPIVPLQQRGDFEREMTEGAVDWQLHLYGGVGHAFTRPGIDALRMPGFAYSKTADERSWQSMLALFAETLGPT
jgi:dienelactone hydrolase